MSEQEVRIRWTWGHDETGRRITEAQPIGYRQTSSGAESVCSVSVSPPASPTPTPPPSAGPSSRLSVRLDRLPGMEDVELSGLVTSEFPPDDD